MPRPATQNFNLFWLLHLAALQGKFGTTGKFKVEFSSPGLHAAGGSEAGASDTQQQERSAADNRIVLLYKKFLYDPDAKRKLRQ